MIYNTIIAVIFKAFIVNVVFPYSYFPSFITQISSRYSELLLSAALLMHTVNKGAHTCGRLPVLCQGNKINVAPEP